MDHHIVAAISISGTCLGVLGSLYLAYDLLGGQHGPLRLLTRAVTYSILFGIGYGIGLCFFVCPVRGMRGGYPLVDKFESSGGWLRPLPFGWEGSSSLPPEPL